MVSATIELKVLQAVRLKGRIDLDAVADTIREDPGAVAEAVGAAIQAGFISEGKTLRLSPRGRTRLLELLAAEREGVDRTAIAAAYERFRAINADFKALVLDWQLRYGEPNQHDDNEYDAAVLARLTEVHARLLPVATAVSAELPRLATYSDKLASALAKVVAGETNWLTKPLVDSYHIVWFELHEELMLAAGLTRADEARAGHAG